MKTDIIWHWLPDECFSAIFISIMIILVIATFISIIIIILVIVIFISIIIIILVIAIFISLIIIIVVIAIFISILVCGRQQAAGFVFQEQARVGRVYGGKSLKMSSETVLR